MDKKSQMSPKAKKVLIGVGIGFGTVVTFMLSFVIAFSLIVNPISFMSGGDGDTVAENKELKEQVQTLEDEVELLNTTIEKYKSSQKSSGSTVVTTPSEGQGSTKQSTAGQSTAKQSSSSQGTSAPSTSGQTKSASAAADSTKADNAGSIAGEAQTNDFSPETEISTGEASPEDADDTVTVIDVSQ